MFPNNLSFYYIPNSCFIDCQNLEKIAIPDSVTAIDGAAFSDCFSLEKVALPSSLERIGSRAFSGCRSLKEIAIPENVNFLGNYIFTRCYDLETIVLNGLIRRIESNAFYGIASGYKIISLRKNIEEMIEVSDEDRQYLLDRTLFIDCTLDDLLKGGYSLSQANEKLLQSSKFFKDLSLNR